MPTSACLAAGEENQTWGCAGLISTREEQIQQAVEDIPAVSGP